MAVLIRVHWNIKMLQNLMWRLMMWKTLQGAVGHI